MLPVVVVVVVGLEVVVGLSVPAVVVQGVPPERKKNDNLGYLFRWQ